MRFHVFAPRVAGAGWKALGSTWDRVDAESILANHPAGYISSQGDILVTKNVSL